MKAVLFFCAFVPFMLAPASLHSQIPCGHKGDMREWLKPYNEVPFAEGISQDGEAVQFLVSPGGTFSILSTRVDGISCLIIAGTDFQVLDVFGRKI